MGNYKWDDESDAYILGNTWCKSDRILAEELTVICNRKITTKAVQKRRVEIGGGKGKGGRPRKMG